ncbi:helix-turn-helix transcriptional regulator [Micromonospora matsumotoense]|uniref:helix-turn-helix domain-containing protein n=1 Tax=Micromonospora matsumotoense TaxID=121616 RepID=UPI0033E67252
MGALTPTEIEIAHLVTEADSTAGIARARFLSPRTVQTDVSRILTKLGLRSRAEIAGESRRREPAEPPESVSVDRCLSPAGLKDSTPPTEEAA